MRERFGQIARRTSAAAAVMLAVAALLDLDLRTAQALEPRTHQVLIEAMQFAPQTLTVAPGDKVVWTNRDAFPHTATAQGRRFDSGEIGTNASWTFTASDRGTFDYVCTQHPTMKATMIVK